MKYPSSSYVKVGKFYTLQTEWTQLFRNAGTLERWELDFENRKAINSKSNPTVYVIGYQNNSLKEVRHLTTHDFDRLVNILVENEVFLIPEHSFLSEFKELAEASEDEPLAL